MLITGYGLSALPLRTDYEICWFREYSESRVPGLSVYTQILRTNCSLAQMTAVRVLLVDGGYQLREFMALSPADAQQLMIHRSCGLGTTAVPASQGRGDTIK
jgi:hypothetical protein